MPSVGAIMRVNTMATSRNLTRQPGRWRIPGSNRRPPPCKGGALPTELIPHWRHTGTCRWGVVVGLSGFEPLTSSLSGMRSNQLSYRPTPAVVYRIR